MGFISFNEGYYLGKLNEYETKPLSDAEIYEVRQLLKVLDDLIDEGYTNLNDRMEADFSCLTRLRAVLKKAGAEPFAVCADKVEEPVYGTAEFELGELLRDITASVCAWGSVSDNLFLDDIRCYCDWIGYNEDTAYVFLLRDTLLPYVYYSGKQRANLYPWLISRKFLEDITKTEFVDDDIRLPLYEALEQGKTDFDDFCAYCEPRIGMVLEEHLELKEALRGLLDSIPQQKIMVLESGYMGTIPMMLKALDDRVDFRLYTTAPFLYETYRDKIFCRKYEDIRKFETLYSQNALMRYSSYREGKFYVNVAEDEDIKKQAFTEIMTMGQMIAGFTENFCKGRTK